MKPSERVDFKKDLIECHAAHGFDSPPENKITAAFKALAEFEYLEVKRALAQAGSMEFRYAPWAGQIGKIIRENRERLPKGVDSRDQRCCYQSRGERCPMRGAHPVDLNNPAGARECERHHDAESAAEKAAVLDDLLRNRPKRWPAWQDAKVAQDLLRSMTQERVAAQFSWSVVRFVQQHTAEFPDIRDFYRANRNRQMKPEKPHQGPFAGPCDTRIGDAIDAAGF